MLEGVDYVSGPSPDLLRKAGKRFACRYVSTVGNAKNLTRAEARALHRAGLAVVVVFETTARRPLDGRQAGRADAASARAQARALGWRRRRPSVYFAVDFDTNPLSAGDMALVVDYVRGAADVLGVSRTGVYGGIRTVTACLAAGVCAFAWQTRAWSGGRWHPARTLEQYGGGTVAGHSVDFDRALHRRFGAWRRGVVWRIVDGFVVRVGSPLWRWLERHGLVDGPADVLRNANTGEEYRVVGIKHPKR